MEITGYLSECIKTQTPVAFLKYGDGEYLAALGNSGCNCDRDTYTEVLKDGLIKSFSYMVDHGPNTFVGIWHDGNHIDFWNKFVEKPIRVAKYHTVIMDYDHINDKIDLLRTIKESPLKKIYICNPLMVRAKILLNIDHMVHVPFNNWVDTQIDSILNQVKSIIDPEEQNIILTSAGMGSKIMVGELTKLFPKNIYIDIGSGLDKICTKKTSRGWEPNYQEFMELLAHIIPLEWESSEYENIFNEAQTKIGVHL
jgi:hypothetical protein